MTKINRNYVSEIDKKMAEFNRTHKRSKSQQAEYDKYQAVFTRRDKTAQPEDRDTINWD